MTPRRAAAYVRVSSRDESTDGRSLEEQEKQIRAYAKTHGYAIVQVYQDRLNTANDSWPGLARLLLDSQTGMFSAVILMDASRLFHNPILAGRYADELRDKLKVEIVFVLPSAPVPADLIPETLNELFDDYVRYELRLRTTLGKQARAQRGLFNGTLPFGYTRGDDGAPVPHPTNSVGLIQAFNLYSTGQLQRCPDCRAAQPGRLSHHGQLGPASVHEGHGQPHSPEPLLSGSGQVQRGNVSWAASGPHRSGTLRRMPGGSRSTSQAADRRKRRSARIPWPEWPAAARVG